MDGTEAALQPGERLAATLSSRQKLTHDTLKLDFTFDDNSKSLGVPIGHHIMLNALVKFPSVCPFRVCLSRITGGVVDTGLRFLLFSESTLAVLLQDGGGVTEKWPPEEDCGMESTTEWVV
jgi:hypothetical protein